MRAILALTGLLAALALGGPDTARAQQLGVVTSDIVVIDTERLLTETEYGKRLQQEIQAARDRLVARNDRIASELEAEEQALTDRRADTPPDEFREMADAFDTKVTRLRNEAERNSQQLERRRERAPLQFMRVVQPVLSGLLDEAEAVVMLDLRSTLLHDNVADVTDLAIMRINESVGAGPDTLPETESGPRDGAELPDMPVPQDPQAADD
ncbi:OmpH family outer membrane protein [Roseovarius sp. D22-M7]|uniref:OmpH family outer membrane protein n=1 Tax=Roseovarius sp. D22-M7 TaxID=3127116 RepID=UPI00300F9AAC